MVSRRALSAGLGALALTVTACGGGPGSEEDLVSALTRDDTFTTAQAECIASAVFDEYEADEEALGRISGVNSFDELNGTDGVAGFDEFFSRTVRVCTNS